VVDPRSIRGAGDGVPVRKEAALGDHHYRLIDEITAVVVTAIRARPSLRARFGHVQAEQMRRAAAELAKVSRNLPFLIGDASDDIAHLRAARIALEEGAITLDCWARPSGREIGEDLVTRNRRRALTIWLGAKPVERGDIVWRYLADRGIDLGRLPHVPSALRCHPGLWNGETQRAWPAMVAMVAMVGDAAGENVAVHRTWLQERNYAFEDRPMVGKAPLVDAKLSLGSFRGGYIRLWRGEGGRPWSSVKPGETLLLSEGIEDLLSYLQYKPQWRAACAVSLSFMMAMDLPPEFTELRILGQRDPRMTPDGKTCSCRPRGAC
jgi:hypothetical protein